MPAPQGSPCWIEILAEDTVALKVKQFPFAKKSKHFTSQHTKEPANTLQNFYAAIFPAWEFRPATEQYKEDAIVMYSFTEPKGLSGGIIKLPEHCTPRGEQPMGAGFTVYYFVESIEAVSSVSYSFLLYIKAPNAGL